MLLPFPVQFVYQYVVFSAPVVLSSFNFAIYLTFASSKWCCFVSAHLLKKKSVFFLADVLLINMSKSASSAQRAAVLTSTLFDGVFSHRTVLLVIWMSVFVSTFPLHHDLNACRYGYYLGLECGRMWAQVTANAFLNSHIKQLHSSSNIHHGCIRICNIIIYWCFIFIEFSWCITKELVHF